MDLFRKKSVDQLVAESTPLKRTMRTFDLTMLGIGAIIGTGIFVLTGKGALTAGPALSVSFLLAAVCCGFAGLCYAEFAAMAPVSGSAYSYAYLGVRRAHRLRDRLGSDSGVRPAGGHSVRRLVGLLQQTAGRLRPAPAGRADRRLRHQPGRHHLLQPARFRHRAHHHVGALHRHQPDQAHQ